MQQQDLNNTNGNLDQAKEQPIVTFNSKDCHTQINLKLSKCGCISLILLSLFILFSIIVAISGGTNYIMRQTNSDRQSLPQEAGTRKVQGTAPCFNAPSNITTPSHPIDVFSSGWFDFDWPKFLYEFGHEHTDEIVISYEHIIPKTVRAKYVKIMFLMKAGPQKNYKEYLVRLRVVNGANIFVHWLQHVAHDNNFLAVGHNVILPVSESRQFLLQGEAKRSGGSMHTKMHIVAYYPPDP